LKPELFGAAERAALAPSAGGNVVDHAVTTEAIA
jgi:hypothetical protein